MVDEIEKNKCYNEMCGYYVFPDDYCCSNKFSICKEKIRQNTQNRRK